MSGTSECFADCLVAKSLNDFASWDSSELIDALSEVGDILALYVYVVLEKSFNGVVACPLT